MKNLLIIPLLGLTLLCHCQTIIGINNTTNTGSNVSNLTVFASKVFFSAEDGINGMGIYSMDNSTAPTRLSPGVFEDPQEFTVLDDRLYFTSGPFQSRQLYCIESSNPSLIFEINNALGDPAEMIGHNGIHYFVNGDEVYHVMPNDDVAFSIGSTNGDLIAKGMPNSTDMTRKYIFVASDKLFFNTSSGIYYIDLLSPNNAELVTNSDNYEYEQGPPGGGDYAGYFVGSKVVYRNIGIGIDSELLLIEASDATPSADFINLSNATSSRPTFFIEHQGILFFSAFNDAENMNIVWYIDDSASTISDFNPILGVLSAQTIFSGASDDPFIKIGSELFHYRNQITVSGGVPTISNTEVCFDYPYFNHQVIDYGGDYYYIGCCFDLFRCNGSTSEKLTCVGGIDNAIGKFVLLDNKFYFSSPTLPSFGIELLRWPEDQGNGICQDTSCNNVALNFDGMDDIVLVASPISGNSNFTIAADFKWEGTSDGLYPRLIGFRNYMTEIAIRNSGEIAVFEGTWRNSGTTINMGEWYNIAFRRDGAAYRLFLNGMEIMNFSGNPSLNFSGNMFIGGGFNLTNEFLNGSIDNVRVWDTALPEIDIQSNYISPSSPISLYFNFEEGDPSGDNTSITGPQDVLGIYQGEFDSFTLNGDGSNYVCDEYEIDFVVSSDDVSKAVSVELNPNPSNGVFTIEATDIEDGLISIYDISGRQIVDKIKLNGKVRIDLSEHQSGVYFVRIFNGNRWNSTRKLLLVK